MFFVKSSYFKFVPQLFVAALIASWSHHLAAQEKAQKVFFQDSVTITVSNISIDNEFSLRGLTADFPYPVLTTISVVNSQGSPISGLADTSRWLAPDDLAQIGLPVRDIWNPVIEFHRDNPSFPLDPNVYNQIPTPLFTEIREASSLPTSTMLIMDASGSMQAEIADAKTGAKLFVDLLRPVDRAGVVVFASEVKQFQGLTDNKEQLKDVIDSATASGLTALYDAIMRGIDELKAEGGRLGVIAYTDGIDNRSINTPQSVIDSARVHHIPVFTIALGDSTREDNLMRVASQTGGLFFKVANAEEMIEVYGILSELVQNFYLMAHSSPDPVRNDTWRVVDVSINTADFQGRGSGQYFVPTIPPPPTDLAISLDSITDTTIVRRGQSLNAVRAGENFQYRLEIDNLGPSRADTVNVFHFLPDSVRFLSSSVLPQSVFSNRLTWQFANFNVGDEIALTVDVQLDADIPAELLQLGSLAFFTTANDIQFENNASTDTVRVLAGPPRIQVTPPMVDVGDSVAVSVRVSTPIQRWDLWATFADGQIDSTYADDFINANQLVPNTWVDVMPSFSDTRLVTSSEQERIVFELRTIDVLGDFSIASASVTVQSENKLVLDRNVFAASREDILNINFKLSSNRPARLDLFDVAGSHITKLADANFNAGWNTLPWDGMTTQNEKIGSGLYMITLRSGGFVAMKKVMVVR